jgi:hypothetical protein
VPLSNPSSIFTLASRAEVGAADPARDDDEWTFNLFDDGITTFVDGTVAGESAAMLSRSSAETTELVSAPALRFGLREVFTLVAAVRGGGAE